VTRDVHHLELHVAELQHRAIGNGLECELRSRALVQHIQRTRRVGERSAGR
jgi:hypothetical protein